MRTDNHRLAEETHAAFHTLVDHDVLDAVVDAVERNYAVRLPLIDAQAMWSDHCHGAEERWPGSLDEEAICQSFADWVETHTGVKPTRTYPAEVDAPVPPTSVQELAEKVRDAKQKTKVGRTIHGGPLDGASVFNLLSLVEAILEGKVDPAKLR